MESDPLKGKTALVTGGTRGIGRAISEKLAEAGSNLILHCRSLTDEVRHFAEHLKQSTGAAVHCVTADFLNPTDIDQMFVEINAAGHNIDILINNAGFETTFAAEDMPFADWEAVLQVNLNAPFRCSQEAARGMKVKGNGGVIINISSIHDSVPRRGLSHYCAAKAGLKMLGLCTALEWAEYGIRVVNVSPGAIETDMNREAIESFGRDKFETWIPVGRLGNTGDVASMVRFLCSDEASYISGTDIYIDGAYMRNLVRYDDRPGRD